MGGTRVGICVGCNLNKIDILICGRAWIGFCGECRKRERTITLAYNNKINHQRLKHEVFEHYGGICQHCKETDLDVLQLDHINNDGKQHRETVGLLGNAFYCWLKKNDYPTGLQVLCRACNCAKNRRCKKLNRSP